EGAVIVGAVRFQLEQDLLGKIPGIQEDIHKELVPPFDREVAPGSEGIPLMNGPRGNLFAAELERACRGPGRFRRRRSIEPGRFDAVLERADSAPLDLSV